MKFIYTIIFYLLKRDDVYTCVPNIIKNSQIRFWNINEKIT